MKIKVAATQMSCDWEIENNIKKSIHLIEKAAEDCASMILSYSHVQKVCIRLSKPNALEQAEQAGISIIRP